MIDLFKKGISEYNNIVCVYRIICLKNKRSYIGSTKNLKRRLYEHRNGLLNNNHHSIKFQNSFNKYGKLPFKFEILKIFQIYDTKNIANSETAYIKKFDSYKNGFNCSEYSHPAKAQKWSDERKRKQSLKRSGIKMSLDQKRRISESKKGTIISKSTRLKISEYHKGKKKSKDHIQKVADACKKPLIQLDKETGKIIKEWPSLTDACLYLGFPKTSVCHALNGRTKTARGFKWKYKYHDKGKIK